MSGPPLRIVVPPGGERVDRLVADASGAGRRAVRRWIEAGLVRGERGPLRGADTPAAGEEVLVWPEASGQGRHQAPATLKLLLEDDRRLVVDKPAGLHCERGRSEGCVADLVEARFGDLSGVGDRPAEAGLVHRLDRDTSGAVLVARTRDEYRRLRRAFQAGSAIKQYLALVSGSLRTESEIDVPLARRSARVAPAGRHDRPLPASTRVQPLEAGSDWTLVLATMSTGVTHQVRAHLALLGHPLFGDALYGGPEAPRGTRGGQLLHAFRVTIAGDLDVTAPVPGDFLEALASLRSGDR